MELSTLAWQYVWYAVIAVLAIWAIISNLNAFKAAEGAFRGAAEHAIHLQESYESLHLRSVLFQFKVFNNNYRVSFHMPGAKIGNTSNSVFKLDGTMYYFGVGLAIMSLFSLIMDFIGHENWIYVWLAAGLVVSSHMLCKVLQIGVPAETQRLLDAALVRYKAALQDMWDLADSRYAVAQPFVELEKLLNTPAATTEAYLQWFTKSMKDTVLYPKCDGQWLVYTSWNIQSGIFYAEDYLKKRNGTQINALEIIKAYHDSCEDKAIRSTLFTTARPGKQDIRDRLIQLGFYL